MSLPAPSGGGEGARRPAAPQHSRRAAFAWKAQQRLRQRYTRLIRWGKNKQQTVTAVGRELLGFIWAIAATV